MVVEVEGLMASAAFWIFTPAGFQDGLHAWFCAPVCSQNNTLEMLSMPVGSLVCHVSTIASIFTLFLLYFHLISAF